MWKYFAHTTPSDALVNSLAGVFAASNMSISNLVEAILLHDEFWSATSRWALVKSPVEFVVDVLRRLGRPSTVAGLPWAVEGMGQALFNPPNVAGWGQNAYWLSTATAWVRGWLSHLKWQLDGWNFWDELRLSGGSAAAGGDGRAEDLRRSRHLRTVECNPHAAHVMVERRADLGETTQRADRRRDVSRIQRCVRSDNDARTRTMTGSGREFSRRRFLQAALVTGSAAAVDPKFFFGANPAFAGPPLGPADHILVLIEFDGGNDGLNTLIPYTNGSYYSMRGGLAIAANTVLPVGDGLGLHPSLPYLKARWDGGDVAIIRGVGHPDLDHSHFSCMAKFASGNARQRADVDRVGRSLSRPRRSRRARRDLGRRRGCAPAPAGQHRRGDGPAVVVRRIVRRRSFTARRSDHLRSR